MRDSGRTKRIAHSIANMLSSSVNGLGILIAEEEETKQISLFVVGRYIPEKGYRVKRFNNFECLRLWLIKVCGESLYNNHHRALYEVLSGLKVKDE